MAGPALILAIPSKGRLQEQVTQYLGDAGLTLKKIAGARDYRAAIAGEPGVDVRLMSSAEIAGALGAGEIHFGITGEDLVRESIPDADAKVTLLQPLGVGFADVVVAVPRAWIDVTSMADLDDVCTAFHARHHRRLRVATKYLALTRNFFAAHGIADYRVVESFGATEGAPAAGLSEAIVDITTTGATLAANDLKVLEDGVILKSQAQLSASLTASWSKDALAAAERLTSRIAARELARNSYLLRATIGRSRAKIEAALAKVGATFLSRSDQGAGNHVILCRREILSDVLSALRDAGVKGAVAAEPVDYVFDEVNPLMQRLRAALKRTKA
ncbi:MAG TPA: ATP phosphoribosyltransferase [Micropepsaceae bacterium]|jgi:ATP phosphoribosyltransferase|nr:ATP phosphoribosyltransferase [Micropepsaceae bacterium]